MKINFRNLVLVTFLTAKTVTYADFTCEDPSCNLDTLNTVYQVGRKSQVSGAIGQNIEARRERLYREIANRHSSSSSDDQENKEAPLRIYPTTTLASNNLIHNGKVKVKVCNRFFRVKWSGKDLLEHKGVKKDGKYEVPGHPDPIPLSDYDEEDGKATSFEQIKTNLFQIFKRANEQELKSINYLKEFAPGCDKLGEFLDNLDHHGTDGSGRDSQLVTAENNQWKYCIKNFKENITTPGHLAKILIGNTKGNPIQVDEIKNYQTIYYHAIYSRLKRYESMKTQVGAKRINAEEIDSKIDAYALALFNTFDEACRGYSYHRDYKEKPNPVLGGHNVYAESDGSGLYVLLSAYDLKKKNDERIQEWQEQVDGIQNLTDEEKNELAICIPSKESMKFWKEVLEEANSNLSRCVALATLTTRQRDYGNTNSFNKPDAGHKSSQGDLECKDIGAQAQDYDWCLSQVIAYETMLAEEKLSQTKFNNDIQQLKASELATQDPNDPTAALKSQVKVLQKTKEQFEYKVAAQGIKAGVLGGMAILHGTLGSNVLTECKKTYKKGMYSFTGGVHLLEGESNTDTLMGAVLNKGNKDKTVEALKELYKALEGFKPGGEEFPQITTTSPDMACERAMLDVEALPNQTMALKAGTLAVKMGADAAAFQLSIGQIDEAISKLNKLITEIENAVDGQIPENPFADLKQNPCLLDPTIEGCFEAGVGTNFGAGAGNVNIDGPEFGLSGAESVNEKKLDENNATGDKAGSKGDINKAKVAGVLNNTSRAKGVQDRVGAARIKTNPGAGGGGGGGGGGASAPGVGGGGGGRGRGGGGGGSNYQRKDYKLGTGGKGSTRAIFSGGQGIGGPGGKKARRDKNPFAKLAKGKSVDKFRNPAAIGKKGNSIWDTITNRYTDIDKKGRLEKYESR